MFIVFSFIAIILYDYILSVTRFLIWKRTDFTWYYILYQANATYLYHDYSKIKMSLLIYTAIKLFEKINSTVSRNESIIFAKINDSKKIKI